MITGTLNSLQFPGTKVSKIFVKIVRLLLRKVINPHTILVFS